MQKPHCRPCNSWKACWIGCREPSGRANPSTVPISRPRPAPPASGSRAPNSRPPARCRRRTRHARSPRGCRSCQLAAQEIRQIHPRLGASLPDAPLTRSRMGSACASSCLLMAAPLRECRRAPGQRQCAARQHRGQALAIPGGHLAVARRDDLAAQPRRLVQIVPYAVAARQRRFDRRHAQRRGGHTAQRQRNARQSSRRIERDQRRDRNDGEVPQRRANSRKAWPCPAGQGWTRMLVRISSASSAGVM